MGMKLQSILRDIIPPVPKKSGRIVQLSFLQHFVYKKQVSLIKILMQLNTKKDF